MPEKIDRRAAREQAFALLFALSFHEGDHLDSLLATRQDADEEDLLDPFALQLAQNAAAHLPELDAEITARLKGWKLERISKASLALLRLAVCEMLFFEDIPVGASINEAVELAKIYCDEDAPRFVNGVLGSIARTGRQEDADPGD